MSVFSDGRMGPGGGFRSPPPARAAKPMAASVRRPAALTPAGRLPPAPRGTAFRVELRWLVAERSWLSEVMVRMLDICRREDGSEMVGSSEQREVVGGVAACAVVEEDVVPAGRRIASGLVAGRQVALEVTLDLRDRKPGHPVPAGVVACGAALGAGGDP